jgi:antitoxin (DNA-binding transcriptional repressor) of toxin-antitoxin stability system
MTVTVSDFRKDLFKLVERVIAGETVEFVHRGTTIRLIIPEGATTSKLDRLTPRRITNPAMTEKQQRSAERKLRSEMLAEMERDWAEI